MGPGGNLIATFHSAAAHRLDHPFLVEPAGVTVTYGEAFDLAAALAGRLRARGVGAGDRVLVRAEKSPTAVGLYLGCLHAGAVHVPLNPGFTDAEVAYFVDDADPALVVDDALLADLVVEARSSAARPAPERRDDSDLAALIYTSGTTGRPKGAALTHANLRLNAMALREVWRIDPGDHLVHILPIFHVHGLFVALHPLMLAAASVTFLPRFTVDAVVEALTGATVVMGVPTHYHRLLADERFDRERCAGIRLFTCGSAPLADNVFDAFAARTGMEICERYGMSEAGIITSNPYDGPRRAGTVGFALPGVALRVVDHTGAIVPPGVTGDVEIGGPHLFAGYWRNPTATADAHRPDGWFRTGDVGHLDTDGRLTHEGRSGDMIISGGENISPKEIELVLDGIEGIEESAVIGAPHPEFGEGVTAIVVAPDGFDTDAAAETLARHLARFKHPKRIVVVDALPRNAMGKVQKAELRARYVALYSPDTAS